MQQPPVPVSAAGVAGPPPQPVTLTHQPLGSPDEFTTASSRQVVRYMYFRLGSIQIVMSFLCIIFGIVLRLTTETFFGHLGYGIWTGVFWLVVGAVGLAAGKDPKNSCKIIAAMVMNIVCAALFCTNMLGFSAVEIVGARSRRCRYYDYGYSYTYRSSGRLCIESWNITELALSSLILIMALMQFIITIWCSVLCCGAVCRCCKTRVLPSTTTTTVYPSRQQTTTAADAASGMPMSTNPVQYPQSAYPTGVNQPGVMIQQPGMNYNSDAVIQHPPPQQGAYYQPQAGPLGYQLQPQTSAGYQSPPEYTQEKTKSVPN